MNNFYECLVPAHLYYYWTKSTIKMNSIFVIAFPWCIIIVASVRAQCLSQEVYESNDSTPQNCDNEGWLHLGGWFHSVRIKWSAIDELALDTDAYWWNRIGFYRWNRNYVSSITDMMRWRIEAMKFRNWSAFVFRLFALCTHRTAYANIAEKFDKKRR